MWFLGMDTGNTMIIFDALRKNMVFKHGTYLVS